jgi:hypothetical protein
VPIGPIATTARARLAGHADSGSATATAITPVPPAMKAARISTPYLPERVLAQHAPRRIELRLKEVEHHHEPNRTGDRAEEVHGGKGRDGRHQTDSQVSWTGATLHSRVQPALQDRHRPATANPDPPHDCIDGLPSEQLATHVGH